MRDFAGERQSVILDRDTWEPGDRPGYPVLQMVEILHGGPIPSSASFNSGAQKRTL